MRLAIVMLGLAFALGTARADDKPAPAPVPTDMGTWDCSGTRPKAVTIDPGEHVFTWHGGCSGAEGWSVIIEPKPSALTSTMTTDRKTSAIVLHVVNHGARPIAVKLHVFVGFA